MTHIISDRIEAECAASDDLATLLLAWQHRQLRLAGIGCGHSVALPGGMCAPCQRALTLGAPAPQPTGQRPQNSDADELSARKDWPR
jgi:hypothetical protein